MRWPRYFQITDDGAAAWTQSYTRDFLLWAARCVAGPIVPIATPIVDRIAPAVIWVYGNKWRRRAFTAIAFGLWCFALAHFRAHAISPGLCTNGNPPGSLDQASNALDSALVSWPDAVVSTLTFPFNALMGLAILVTLIISFTQAAGGRQWGWELFLGTIVSFGLAFSLFQAAPTFGPSLTDYIVSRGTGLPTGPALSPAYGSIRAISPGDAWVRFSCLSDELYAASQKNDKAFNFLVHPITTLEVAAADEVSEIATFGAGAFATFELLAVKIEAPIVLAVGAILVLGLAVPMLWQFPLQYLGAIVGLGLKVVALSVICGLLFSLADTYSSSITSSGATSVGLTPHVAWSVCWGLVMCTAALVFVPNILQRLGGSPGIPGGSMIAAVSSGGKSVGNWMQSQFNGGGGGSDDKGGGGGDAADAATEAATDTATEAAETVPEVVLP